MMDTHLSPCIIPTKPLVGFGHSNVRSSKCDDVPGLYTIKLQAFPAQPSIDHVTCFATDVFLENTHRVRFALFTRRSSVYRNYWATVFAC